MAKQRILWRLQWWTMVITFFVFVVIMQLGRCDTVEQSYSLPSTSEYVNNKISTPLQTSLNTTQKQEIQVVSSNQVYEFHTTEDELMGRANNKEHNNVLMQENVMSTTSSTSSTSTAVPTKKPEDKSNATDDNKTDDKNSSSSSSSRSSSSSTSTSSITSTTITTTKSVAPTTSTSSSTTSSTSSSSSTTSSTSSTTSTSSTSSTTTTSEPTSDTASNETGSNEPECSTKTTHGTFSSTFVCVAFIFGVCCGVAVSRFCSDSKCLTPKCCDKMSTLLHKWYYLLRYRGSMPAYSRAINGAVEQDDISHGDELYDVAEKDNTHMTHSRPRHWHDLSPSSSLSPASAAALTTDKQSKVSELLSFVPQSVMSEKRKNAVALHKRVELDVPTWTQSTPPAHSESPPPAITARPASLLTSRKNATLTSDNVEMLPLTKDQYSQQRQEQSALGYAGSTTLNAMDD